MRRQNDHCVARRLDLALNMLDDGPMKLPPRIAHRTLSQPSTLRHVKAFWFALPSSLSFAFSSKLKSEVYTDEKMSFC